MKNEIDFNWYVPYSQFAEDLQTGDILLVHGRYPESIIIEAIQWSPFSHVGMVVRASDIGLSDNAPELLLWEANSLINLPNVINQQTKEGPMLVDLTERLRTTAGEFEDVKYAFRHLHVEDRASQYKALEAFIPSVLGAGFPPDLKMLEMFLAGRYQNKAIAPDVFFCSELIAFTYMTMGLLNTKYVMNAYAPKDFSAQGTTRLSKRAFWGDEIFVDINS